MSKRWAVWAIAIAMLGAAGAGQAEETAVDRGRYLFHAGGCYGCHTDVKNKGEPLAGGREIKTEFGTFYGPNITPDPIHGIGRWSDADFVRAMREGVSPGGRNYFPVFPYTSFTRINDRDLLDLKAYIFSVEPVARSSPVHDVSFPFSWRFLQTFWKWLNFSPGPMQYQAEKSQEWNRGAYLVRALGHCAECHTPRTALGGLDAELDMAGSYNSAEDVLSPNITPDPETGIGSWSEDDIVMSLKLGMLPDGDFMGSAMAEVVEHGTSKLTDQDLKSIAVYLKSLPPIRHEPARPAAPTAQEQ